MFLSAKRLTIFWSEEGISTISQTVRLSLGPFGLTTLATMYEYKDTFQDKNTEKARDMESKISLTNGKECEGPTKRK